MVAVVVVARENTRQRWGGRFIMLMGSMIAFCFYLGCAARCGWRTAQLAPAPVRERANEGLNVVQLNPKSGAAAVQRSTICLKASAEALENLFLQWRSY